MKRVCLKVRRSLSTCTCLQIKSRTFDVPLDENLLKLKSVQLALYSNSLLIKREKKNLWKCNYIKRTFIIELFVSFSSSKHSHRASVDGNKNNISPFPVLFFCSCYCHHLPPPARPSPHLFHFSCNHVAMQMLCTERFVLPSPGHHSQLPEPLS